MNGLNLLPLFAAGLAGSVHCVGMCGGVVGALSTAGGGRIQVVRGVPASLPPRVLAYNAGRIASYMIAGAMAGGLAQGAANMVRIAAVQSAGYWLANAMLLMLGLYLMDAWRGLARVEAAGAVVWRRVQPAIRHFMPMDTLPKAFALGALWGWIPCGMVYSVLLTALLSGSALNGALAMLAFGLGTLPMLLALGVAGARLRAAMQRKQVRIAAGLLVLGFGLLGLARAATGATHGWLDALCLTVLP
ncbi:sulfite exporter TauE/SafE family protein [Massilia endophytica]|uniref:sulfite exporter TauE/SafE family protein n=1 Tax=Massilia endophytica TaxID=2899220 RepID=UPI001E55511B|nr:sulfite exporter TauE/SafE family protein [Massilia endophytica]UGQ46437.1 sulfite exporter TauE/SafE family protein [Massilia endophytica]